MGDANSTIGKKPNHRLLKSGLLVMLSLGVIAIIYSIYLSSTTLILIGLSLTFWGSLVLFIIPSNYVESEVLDSIAASPLSTINKIIADSNCHGKGIYLPPYPKDVYLPLSHLKGLKDGLVYVPKEDDRPEAQIDEAFTRNPPGLSIIPPGLSLAKLLEKRMATDLFNSDIDSLIDRLPSLLVDDIGLAKEVKINSDKNLIHVEINELTCEALCGEVNKLTNVCPNLGCPLTSAIACLITKVSGKPVIIEKCRPENGAIEAQYRILGD